MNIENISATLHKNFGFNTFLEGQEQVVQKILQGYSTAAIFPTGAGKSLCYQLPAIMLPGLTLVVSPLLSLMQDQLTFLKSRGIAAASLDSTLERDEYNDVLKQAKEGQLKILMISVERFRNERFRTHLEAMNISLLAVDEAHCISEWGHNFRPEYLKLAFYVKQFNIPQVLLLTATATTEVARDMCNKLGVQQENCIRTGFYRENLHLHMTPMSEDQRIILLKQRLGEIQGSTIVYVTLQKTADYIAQVLIEEGMSAASYHAGLENDTRKEIQDKFMNNAIRIVVATIAFGMGIDKSNIRSVIHFDLPKSIENYSQEIGRAGRDGGISHCELFGCADNIPVLENFVYGDTPQINSIGIVLKEIASAGNTWEVQIGYLSRISNIRELTLKTLLVYLELQGIIQPMYSYFGMYKFKTDYSSNEILDKFNGEPREFLKGLLRYSEKKKTWIHIDVNKFSRETGADRKRAVAALEYCDNHNLIELAVSSSVDMYRVIDGLFDTDQLAVKIENHFSIKEKHEINRIRRMISFFESDRCLSVLLAEYFGEHLTTPCGHCSVCKGNPGQMIRSKSATIDSAAIQSDLAEFKSIAGEWYSTETATRFLCGIAMPIGRTMKLKTLKGFGSCSTIPYGDVYEIVKREN
jgi:ATP-dependent DNA helicase RecQ